jgi:hypothetical protein
MRTITECVTSPGRGARRSCRTSLTGTVAEPELCPVVSADPHPLDESKGCATPGDRLAHIGMERLGFMRGAKLMD